MKKLNLNVANLGATEVLSREELKKVLGGIDYGSGTCGAYVPGSNSLGSLPAGSTFIAEEGGSVTPAFTIWRGISKDAALALTNGISGAKWCCSSCNDSSWYNSDILP